MSKKVYEEGSFGAYFVKLIKDHKYSQTEFAKQLNISKTYLFDLFNGRVKPPAPDMQIKIVKLLNLSDCETIELYNKSAEGRNELPKDIFDYLKNNSAEIENLREIMRRKYG